MCLLLAQACTAHAETVTGLVVGIADGDTITVLDRDRVQHKIRLAGIEALLALRIDELSSKSCMEETARCA